jgi:trehalose 6-phosphate synthase
MWTKDSLEQYVAKELGDYKLLVVSNREPYIHTYAGDEIQCLLPTSGLTTALDPVMRACAGTWVAHGSGNADMDVTNGVDKVMVPPQDPRYSLRRVWLTKAQEDGYYYGFANQGLWPLCHIAYTRPVFDAAHWESYQQVNRVFADAVCQEIGGQKALVFVQDYQLALLPRYIKERKPDAVTAHFWHIPWPNREAFRVCPWQQEILDGLLYNDLMAFHIQYHCNNFLDTVDRTIESLVDYDRNQVTRGGRTTAVRPFPISVDFQQVCRDAQVPEVEEEMEALRHELDLAGQIIGMGLDRYDYTKGILERLRALDRFFQKYPEYLGRMTFVQAGVASRAHIPAYKRLNEEVDDLVEEVNWRHGAGRWRPVICLRQDLSQTSLLALRRLSSYAIVSPLHDGMNLVAKEYVASRFDEDGVLILSPFTGAAQELTDALLVNPYATEFMADAIKTAIEMPLEERRRRMRQMRQVVRENNIYKWAADIIGDIARLAPRDHGAAEAVPAASA